MLKTLLFGSFIITVFASKAQLVDVEYNYNNVGDCILGAHNQSKTPLYMNLWFTTLENTSFREPLPYIKKLDPGFNSLFTLPRESDEGAPYFIFQVKTFRSDPVPVINLDFPYLIPFEPGAAVKPVDVKNIDGFWGADAPKAWKATGFEATPGMSVFAARQGQIVEITGERRTGDAQTWYSTWTNAITLLQPDGTLIIYKNVTDPKGNLTLNQKIHAGELLGEVAPGVNEVVVVVCHYSLYAEGLQFLIPQFLTAPGKIEIVNSAQTIQVVHPNEVRGLEMTKKEQRQLLK
ncbi:MAG: hypothetical protein AB7S72_12690 [Draconibacterium sp.]